MNISISRNEVTLFSNELILRNKSFQESNDTIQVEEYLFQVNEKIKPIMEYLLIILLVVMMLTIGCETSWSQLKDLIKHPTAVCISTVSQFFIIPLTAYALMRSSDITGLYATTTLIIPCCPSGIISSTIVYFSDGDLPLSVVLNLVSTFLAMVMMPVNLWIYRNNFETTKLILPHRDLALSLLFSLSFVTVGIFLRRKYSTLSTIITKVARYLGPIIIVISLILEVVSFPMMFAALPGKFYGLILTLPMLGFFLGYTLAFSFRLGAPVRKAIAVDIGTQNALIALNVISASYDREQLKCLILLPWLYHFILMSGYTIFCIAYHVHKGHSSSWTKPENSFHLELQDNLHSAEEISSNIHKGSFKKDTDTNGSTP